MELDELKKTWKALDEHLQKEPIANEKQLETFIAEYKTKTHNSLTRLLSVQRTSLLAGLVVLLLFGILLPLFFESKQLQEKIYVYIAFIGITIIAGTWWDWKTYCWNRQTRVDEMPVAEVSRRMTVFTQWAKYEVIAISVWTVIFNIINYWARNYHLAPAKTQVLLISCFLLLDVLIIYTLYKKLLYKHLNNIKKNIEELNDICCE